MLIGWSTALIIELLRQQNDSLKVLGLTATPYRLAMGWIYRYHYRQPPDEGAR